MVTSVRCLVCQEPPGPHNRKLISRNLAFKFFGLEIGPQNTHIANHSPANNQTRYGSRAKRRSFLLQVGPTRTRRDRPGGFRSRGSCVAHSQHPHDKIFLYSGPQADIRCVWQLQPEGKGRTRTAPRVSPGGVAIRGSGTRTRERACCELICIAVRVGGARNALGDSLSGTVVPRLTHGLRGQHVIKFSVNDCIRILPFQ